MAYRPPEACVLIFGHGFLAFFESRDGQRIRECERSARFGLEEELVGDTAVFIFVASSLANVLKERGLVSLISKRSKKAIYRFCDRRFRHQRRLEVEHALGILRHECTAIACIAFDGHGTVQGIWI